MKTIEKDELFDNVKGFLASKGIQLSEGSYAQTIHKSCRILADVINMGQQGIERAKGGLDRKLDQVRKTIHEKTAPKPPRTTTDSQTHAPESAKQASSPAAEPPKPPTPPSRKAGRVRKPSPTPKRAKSKIPPATRLNRDKKA